MSLASTLDEVDNALRTDNAFILYRYSAALLVCALTFFLWSARGGSGEQQAVDIKAIPGAGARRPGLSRCRLGARGAGLTREARGMFPRFRSLTHTQSGEI